MTEANHSANHMLLVATGIPREGQSWIYLACCIRTDHRGDRGQEDERGRTGLAVAAFAQPVIIRESG
jgi:hypothetical protein